MFKFEKSNTRAQQTASQNEASRAKEDLERLRDEKAAQVKRLRALRLAKEADEK